MAPKKSEVLAKANRIFDFSSEINIYDLYKVFNYKASSELVNIYHDRIMFALRYLTNVEHDPYTVKKLSYRENFKFGEREDLETLVEKRFRSDLDKINPEHAIQRHIFYRKNYYQELGDIFGYEVDISLEENSCKIDLISYSENKIKLIELKKCSFGGDSTDDSDSLIHSILEILTYKLIFNRALNKNSWLINALKKEEINECNGVEAVVLGSENLRKEYEYIAEKYPLLKEFIDQNIILYKIEANCDASNLPLSVDKKVFSIEKVN